MSMREKIADLLARQNGYTSLMAMPSPQRDKWRDRADAVLDALMEPTGDMVEVGWDELHHPAAVYRAMIQAARDGK